MPHGTNVTSLTPTITHTGTSISPASGTAQNFANPITYTVTAQNGDTRTYTITVTIAAPQFVAVTNITGVNTANMTAGQTRNLTGTATPANATNPSPIAWSIYNAGTTNATITSGNTLNVPNAGTVIIRATITNGVAVGTAFTQNFTITVNAPTTGGGNNESDTSTAHSQPSHTNAQNPRITTQPQGGTVYIDEPFNLSVTANVTDGGVLSYQWYRATGASGGGFVRINGATDPIFYPSTTTAGVNRYRVVITNTNNAARIDGNQTSRTTSHIVTVTVNTPAIITDPPPTDTTPPNVNYNPPTGAMPMPFADVHPNDWFYPFVRTVWEQQLFTGTAPNTFDPQGSMTRAMFVQVLANMENINTAAYQANNSTAPRFTDTNPARWYFGAVEWAAGQGLVSGIGGGNFAPDRPITRQEMAVMLHNYITSRNISLPNGATPAFTDQNNISDWAVTAVTAIQAAGIITGHPNGNFAPTDTATRAEVATIFARYLEVTGAITLAAHPPATGATTGGATSGLAFFAGMDIYIDRSALEALERATAVTNNEGQ